MWDRRNADGELVTLLSAQCGETEEWKPRALVSVLVVLAMTTGAYFKRQLLERSAVRQLVATVGLRERVWEIASSLLPPHVIPKLEQRASRRASQVDMDGGSIFSLAEKHDSVIILYADVVGFTGKCAKVGVEEVFDSISMLFNSLDDLCRKFELTKIETIGDAYWCSHGLSTRATQADARRMLSFASALRKIAGGIKIAGESLQVRIGMHVGPMLGGIVGNRFPRYHLFGPHAKVGQLLEQAGNAEATLVSDSFRRLLIQRERETSSAHSASEDVPAVARKYLQKLGSSVGSGLGGMKILPTNDSSSGSRSSMPTDSWNVLKWQAELDEMPGGSFSVVKDGHDLPARLGPVILERDSRNRVTHGVELNRHDGMAQSACSSLDPTVAELVLPTWFISDIEHESDDHPAKWRVNTDVTLEISGEALHDAKVMAGEGCRVELAILPDTTLEAGEGGDSTQQGAEIGRSTCMPIFRRWGLGSGKFRQKISPESSRTSSPSGN